VLTELSATSFVSETLPFLVSEHSQELRALLVSVLFSHSYYMAAACGLRGSHKEAGIESSSYSLQQAPLMRPLRI
jgi:hypothetical protein